MIRRGLGDAVLSLSLPIFYFAIFWLSIWRRVGVPASDAAKPGPVNGKYGRNILSTCVKEKKKKRNLKRRGRRRSSGNREVRVRAEVSSFN